MSARAFKIVEAEPTCERPPIRIDTDYDAIKRRDWASVHVRGDRAVPLCIADRVRRVWRG